MSYPASVTEKLVAVPSMATDGATELIDVAWMYARVVTVVAAPTKGPGIPDGEVARMYTHQVPGAIATETVEEPDASVPVPHAARPDALVRPALAA